jgi:hypothetical protein
MNLRISGFLAIAAFFFAPGQSRAADLTPLVSFNGINGEGPQAGLIADADGNLFGTTAFGGAYGGGTAFEIAKAAADYASTPTTLVNFNIGSTDGYRPLAGLIADANGNLFGTASQSGVSDYGTVFKIAKTATGYASNPTTLVNFNGTNGENPLAGLIADANGNLLGTTYLGGAYGDGSVFEITGSGFTVPVTFAGAPGKPNCHGKSVSALAQQFGGLNGAAAALGFASIGALQNAIMGFCGG